MMRKFAIWSLPLVFAVVAPIAAFSGKDCWVKVRSALASLGQSSPASASRGPLLGIVPPAGSTAAPAQGTAGPLAAISPSAEVPASRSLDEVFRFDVDSGWVIAHWPRVSAGLAELQLQGYRVPLVSGTSPGDLAGALTYYFNTRQQVQRITFYGTTGDYGKVVQFLTTRYGFARRTGSDPRLFRYELVDAKNEPVSYLDVRPAEVMKAEDANRRFQVTLQMERPAD
jgi:hypothetical protein